MLAALSQLPLEWNTPPLFNTDIGNFVGKTDEGEEKTMVLLIFVLCQCFNHQWARVCQFGQKVGFRVSLI